VWFHNREFRTAVLMWKDPNVDDANESSDQGNIVICYLMTYALSMLLKLNSI